MRESMQFCFLLQLGFLSLNLQQNILTHMNIVVLDGYGLNPGDLSWGEFEAMGKLTVHDRTAPEQIVERAAEADAVLTNKTVLDADTLRSLPRLKYIGVLATGYNVVDTAAARECGITVTNIPPTARHRWRRWCLPICWPSPTVRSTTRRPTGRTMGRGARFLLVGHTADRARRQDHGHRGLRSYR